MKWDVPCRQTLWSRCSARLTLQLASKHAQLTVTTGPFGVSALDGSFHPAGHFLEEALLNDNVNLETIPKIASSGAQNRRVGFAIATLLEAKLSAAQNGAIHGPLSHLPPPLYPVDSGWLPIVSAAIHHDSFEQDVTQRHSLPPRGARHIGIRAKERKRIPYTAPLLRLSYTTVNADNLTGPAANHHASSMQRSSVLPVLHDDSPGHPAAPGNA